MLAFKSSRFTFKNCTNANLKRLFCGILLGLVGHCIVMGKVSEVAVLRKSDPVCSGRNTTDKSAEVFFGAQQDKNSAHMQRLDKPMQVERV